MTERTLGIIKPDAMQAKAAGKIIDLILDAGFGLAAVRLLHLSRVQAEGFYRVHRERPFFPSLTTFMSEGPILVMVLEREDAIRGWRDLMGPTNPAQAAAGTIRKSFGSSIERNAVHGSDSPESAASEIAYFFGEIDLVRV